MRYCLGSRIPRWGRRCAEAVRRGGEWVAVVDQRAALAVKWYGRRPLKGEDLRTSSMKSFAEMKPCS